MSVHSYSSSCSHQATIVSNDFSVNNLRTFRGRCQQEITDRNSIASREKNSALANKIGAYALATFFVIAASAATVLAAIYLPILLPVVVGSIGLLILKTKSIVQKLFTQAASHELIAQRTLDIGEEYDALTKNEITYDAAKASLNQLVPGYQANSLPADLFPLLAH